MADPGWGIWGKFPSPLTLWRSLIYTKLCQANISLSTHENMHILLAFITNSPETKANQSQTSCEIVTQHLCAYYAPLKIIVFLLFKTFRSF